MFTFVYDVLVPEVVVRLLMEAHSISYGDVSAMHVRMNFYKYISETG